MLHDQRNLIYLVTPILHITTPDLPITKIAVIQPDIDYFKNYFQEMNRACKIKVQFKQLCNLIFLMIDKQ